MRGHSLGFIAFAVCFAPTCLLAQGPRGTDLGEFAAYFGPTFGGIGSHPFVGASSFAELGEIVLIGVEAAYMSTGDQTLRQYPDPFVVRNARLYDFNVTLQVRVPKSIKRFHPYGLLSLGVQHATFESLTGSDQNMTYIGDRTDNFGFATGGGARYYVKENWGIRPEVRVCISAKTYVRVSVGVFAEVTGGNWLLPRKLGSWLNPLR